MPSMSKNGGAVEKMEPVNTRRTDGSLSIDEDISHLCNEDAVGEEEAVSPMSRIFHDPGFNTHIIAILGFSTPISLEVFKEKLSETLLKHPRFSSIVVKDLNSKGALKWVRISKVDLEYHLIVPSVPPTILDGSRMVDKFVNEYIYNLSKTRLDYSRPLWDLHLLNIKTSKEEGFGIFRIHHSLGDGISLISLLLACSRKVTNPEALPTMPLSKKRNKEGGGVGIESNFGGDGGTKFYWKRCWRVLVFLWGFLEIVWNTCVDLLVFSLTLCFLKDTNAIYKENHNAECLPRRVVYRTVSLDDMKLVKNMMDATISDVALGMTQAGLSCYLDKIHAHDVKSDNEATKKKFQSTKKTRMRSAIIVNIRPSPSIEELTNMMEKASHYIWGNRVGFVLLPFSIGSKDDPLDHVREAKAIIDKKKRSFGAMFTYLSYNILVKLFGDKVAVVVGKRLFKNTTLTFSSLVGPVDEIRFCGHQMTFLAPTGYGFPQGLSIHFVSYTNHMTIVISADESTIDDPYQLSEDIVESLKLMKEEATLTKQYAASTTIP